MPNEKLLSRGLARPAKHFVNFVYILIKFTITKNQLQDDISMKIHIDPAAITFSKGKNIKRNLDTNEEKKVTQERGFVQHSRKIPQKTSQMANALPT